MLSGNDSGFRVTTDGGLNWKRADLPTSTWFDIAYDMDTPFHVVGSVQDHGSYRSWSISAMASSTSAPVATDSGATGIEGEYCAHLIDPTNPNIIYSDSEGITRTDMSIPAPPRGGGDRRRRPPAGRSQAGRAAAQQEVRPPTGRTRPAAYASARPARSSRRSIRTRSTSGRSICSARAIAAIHWEKLDRRYERQRQDADWRNSLPGRHFHRRISEEEGADVCRHGRRTFAYVDGRWQDVDEADAGIASEEVGGEGAGVPVRRVTVYLAQQGRYDDDFAAYLYKSTDYGKTWKSIAGNLPGGPINMIREDPVKPNVLYTCNDFGVYVGQ